VTTERERGFLVLHGQYQIRVLNYIRRRISSEEVAEELAADVFRIAWQKYDGVKDFSIGWFLTVARNLIGNEYQGR
jgi:DNA-directed RNA polymerase specialized sigma24 family protein